VQAGAAVYVRLIRGIVGLSAAACVAALVFTVGQRGGPSPRPGAGVGPGGQARVETPVDETWDEARAVVEMRNARRRRRGEPETDPDVEAAEILRELEDGTV
jgi:hypothetical protein